MISARFLLLIWSFIALQVLAVRFDPYSGELVRRDERPPNNSTSFLPPPTKDPWYSAPDGWEKAAPGAVLRTRTHAYPSINIRNCIDTFQVLYRTTDSLNNASWAVVTVFIPKSHKNCSEANPDACSHGLVSYQVPTDSADLDAAPSYLLQSREPYGEMRDMLAKGWFVMVPDYEGPLASFCAGVQAGHATLDAARAVLQVAGRFGLRMDRVKLGLWGYSGGAFAAEFAVELAGTYAPELRIDAAVVGGPSPNLTTVDQHMNNRDTAGLVVASLLGITMQRPEARKYLLSRLRPTGPRNSTAFLNATTMTGVDALVAYANQDVGDYFVNGSADLWGPVLQDVIDSDAVMGFHGTPTMPCFYYKAIQDEMSPVPETDVLVDRFCRAGANILYHRNTKGGHNDELWSGRLRALDYLAAKLDGTGNITIPATGCATVNVSVALDPLYLLPDWWWTEGPGAGLGPVS